MALQIDLEKLEELAKSVIDAVDENGERLSAALDAFDKAATPLSVLALIEVVKAARKYVASYSEDDLTNTALMYRAFLQALQPFTVSSDKASVSTGEERR